jgi:lipoate-protein ligase A
MEPPAWRLIDTGPLDGPRNMAVDEALLRHFDQGAAPVLRLYGWEPPAFSVGRFQKADEAIDRERCRRAGIPVVRRITGGGLIYHGPELTYSLVCAPRHIAGAQGVKESFRTLTGFLLRFYGELGLAACWAADDAAGDVKLGARTPLCFAGREESDIVIGGRKIGGNAQRRLRDAIFQHGSIPLADGVGEALPFFRSVPAGLREGTTDLAALGVPDGVDRLRRILARSFSAALGVALVPSELSPEEREAADRLLRERYNNDGWNFGGENG